MKKFIMPLMLGLVAMAAGMPGFLSVLKSTYNPPAGSAATKCTACHVAGKTLNPYGLALKNASGGKAVTSATLKAVEKLDSDGDGMANGAELKAGRNPGVKG